MIQRVFIILLSILVLSCAEEVITKPENLIPREKMTQILYELALLNSAKNTGSVLLEEEVGSPTAFIFKQYEVDSLQFVKSDIYYASQPLVYEAIYKDIADRLEKQKELFEENRKKRYDSVLPKKSQLRDSLVKKDVD